MIGILPYVINTYLEARSLFDPTASVMRAFAEHGQEVGMKQDDLKSVFGDVQGLRPSYEGGKISLHLDEKTTLGFVETYIKKSFATEESGTIATFRSRLSDRPGESEIDAELKLPTRSILLKFVPDGVSVRKYADSQIEKIRHRKPSELWLIIPTDETVNIELEPVFSENKVRRGRIRTLKLAEVFSELIGKNYEVSVVREEGNQFKLLASRK